MKNTLQTQNFRFTIPDKGISDDFQWQVVDVSIPTITLAETSISAPKMGNMRQPGAAITYGDIDIEFLMDAQFDAYTNIYTWMMNIINTTSNNQAPDPTFTGEKDAVLHILNNTGSEVITAFKFNGLFPTSLMPLNFTYGSTGAIDAVTCSVTFSFRDMLLLNSSYNQIIN